MFKSDNEIFKAIQALLPERLMWEGHYGWFIQGLPQFEFYEFQNEHMCLTIIANERKTSILEASIIIDDDPDRQYRWLNPRYWKDNAEACLQHEFGFLVHHHHDRVDSIYLDRNIDRFISDIELCLAGGRPEPKMFITQEMFDHWIEKEGYKDDY